MCKCLHAYTRSDQVPRYVSCPSKWVVCLSCLALAAAQWRYTIVCDALTFPHGLCPQLQIKGLCEVSAERAGGGGGGGGGEQSSAATTPSSLSTERRFGEIRPSPHKFLRRPAGGATGGPPPPRHGPEGRRKIHIGSAQRKRSASQVRPQAGCWVRRDRYGPRRAAGSDRTGKTQVQSQADCGVRRDREDPGTVPGGLWGQTGQGRPRYSPRRTVGSDGTGTAPGGARERRK